MPASAPAPAEALPSPLPNAPAAVPPKQWRTDEAQLVRVLCGPVVAHLSDLGLIDVAGPDALAFLNAQATADFADLDPERFALAGYCSPKGRLLAIFHAWRTPAGARLLLPRELVEPTLRRLAMFVLRSKVRLSDVSEDFRILGVCGPGGGAALVAAGIAPPAQAGRWRPTGADTGVARLAPGTMCRERFMMVDAAGRATQLEAALASVPTVDPGVWWWSQIDAAVPQVFAATRELFVPQSVNLELLGGVSFRKGCYPGQEVVARSQYRGKLRRRMSIAHAARIGADGEVYHSEHEQPVGRIVMAASAPGGGWDLLAEFPTELAEHGSLHAGGPSADALALRPLPYPIFDPTE